MEETNERGVMEGETERRKNGRAEGRDRGQGDKQGGWNVMI